MNPATNYTAAEEARSGYYRADGTPVMDTSSITDDNYVVYVRRPEVLLTPKQRKVKQDQVYEKQLRGFRQGGRKLFTR